MSNEIWNCITTSTGQVYLTLNLFKMKTAIVYTLYHNRYVCKCIEENFRNHFLSWFENHCCNQMLYINDIVNFMRIFSNSSVGYYIVGLDWLFALLHVYVSKT